MNLHEYQSKELLQKFSIPSPPFQVVTDKNEIEKKYALLNSDKFVLKVQIHAGGRGKAGGIKIGKGIEEVTRFAHDLLGKTIINKQTGKEGLPSHHLLLTPVIDYKKEFYVAALVNRAQSQAVLMISPYGGMEIEEIAIKHPEAIHIEPIQNDGDLRNYQLIAMAKFMGWDEKSRSNGMRLLKNLAKAFFSLDASLIEINPLVLLTDDSFSALDAKISIDDNALFRHEEIAHQFDDSQTSSIENLARKYDLAYIPLDGNIGCMVNGAGLAMATMDIIEFYGGKPANFLDVGGGASQEKVAQGFRIILSDRKVKAMLINIFGGIMNCETLARGLVEAAQAQNIDVPIVVRLEGTNAEQGRKTLAESGVKMIITNSLSEAAEKVVHAAK